MSLPLNPDQQLDPHYLNAILMSMAGSLVVIGPEATIHMVNVATLEMTGYTEDELIGQPFDMLLIGKPFSSSSDKLSKHGFVRQGERTYKAKDGTRIPVSFSSAVIRDERKRVLGIVCVAQDITYQKQMEYELQRRATQFSILHQVDEELTHMLSVAHVLNIGLDIAMRLSAADAGGIALIEGDQLISAYAVGYPPTVHEDAHLHNGVIARVVRRRTAELILDVRADPHYTPVLPATQSMMILPLVSQDKLLGLLYMETERANSFTDENFRFMQLLTARIAASINNAQLYDTSRRRLSELQALYARISALEQIKTDMIRIAAHDLRNPLSNIGLSTKLIRRTAWDALDETARERIADIEQAVARMERITANILSLERINEVASGETRDILDIKVVVQQAFDEHRSQAAHKNLTLTLEMLDAPLFVSGDAMELHEAAANFISNAIKYTPEGGRIRVTVEQHGGSAVFEVRDNGYGIPDDQQAQLFQPFYRAQTRETTEIEGTGLGLHLVKNIIERHRGQIRFQSKRGEGSLFGFQLPVVQQVAAHGEERTA